MTSSLFTFSVLNLGQESFEIAIKPRLFAEGYELYSGMDTYKVQLAVRREGSTAKATSYTILSLNEVKMAAILNSGKFVNLSTSCTQFLALLLAYCNGWFME